MRGMIDELMRGLLAAYEDLLATGSVPQRSQHASDMSHMALNQCRALQLLFDLKFLASILFSSSRDESEVHTSS